MAAAWIRPLECGACGVRVDSIGVGCERQGGAREALRPVVGAPWGWHCLSLTGV